MIFKNIPERFGFITKSFHWVMAGLIFCLLCLGYQMEQMPPGPDKVWMVGLHKSFGVLILVLACGRLFWRFVNPRPGSEPTIKPWEEKLSHVVHFLLYFTFFAMPLTGWIMSSAGEYPVRFFGLFNLPPIAPKNPVVMGLAREAHEILAVSLLVLLFLHFSGAAKHHVVDHDNTFKRMTWQRMGYGAGILLLGVLGLLYLLPVKIFATGLLAEEEDVPQQQSAQIQEAPVAAGEWVVDQAASTIKFQVTQYGSAFEGSFKNFTAHIVFDPENLAQSRAEVRIPIAGITTGDAERDQQALMSDWFDAAQFPEIIFTSDSFEHVTGDQYVAHGKLNLRGIEKPVDLNFTYVPDAANPQQAEVKGSLTLQRLAFGVGQGEWQKTDIIGDSVPVNIYVKATRAP